MRSIRPEDSEPVAALIRRAFVGLPVDPPPSALHITADDLRAHLAAGGGGVIVDPARACLLWVERTNALHISRLAVDPAHRRMGLATAMLAEAERETQLRGLSRLTLATRLALPGNRRLFERHGFVEIGRTAHPGFDEPTSIDLEKQVTNPAHPQASRAQ